EQKIRPKGQGRDIHISELLCELLGRVHLTEERHAAHSKIPNHNKKKEQPKGIKEVMIERKIWNKRLRSKCVKCSKDEEKICCNMKKLARQLDFMEQKSILEEIVLG
ncbi:22817_t:CDS:2, partial [Gigaspora margarita]